MRWFGALVGAVSFSSGCGFEPNGAAPLEVPPSYYTWWAEVERCAQQSADIGRVRFWVVKGENFPCPNGPCIGHWRSPHHVYVAEAWVNDAALVKHEMLHDILGSGEHPRAVFGPTGCNVLLGASVSADLGAHSDAAGA